MLDTIHWLCLNFIMTLGDKDSLLHSTNKAMEMPGMHSLFTVTQLLYSLAERLAWSSFKTPPSFHHTLRETSVMRGHQIPTVIANGQSSSPFRADMTFHT